MPKSLKNSIGMKNMGDEHLPTSFSRRYFLSAVLTVLILTSSIVPFSILISPARAQVEQQVPYDEIPPSSVDISVWNATTGNWWIQIIVQGLSPTLEDISAIDWLDLLTYEGISNADSLIFEVYPADPPRYWRFYAMDYYTGRVGDDPGTWLISDNTTYIFGGVSAPFSTYTIRMNFTHATQYISYIPCLVNESGYPQMVANSINITDALEVAISRDNYGAVILDASFSSSGTSYLEYKVNYVEINLTKISMHSLPPNETTIGEDLKQYLQIPENDLPESVKSFITSTFSRLEGNSTFEIALKVLLFYQEVFSYDLEMLYHGSSDKPTSDEDWVAWFIRRKSGISLHFATAYAITLRLLKIPARVVLGFLPGVKEGDVRKVYAYHLHFWVEVWIPYEENGVIRGAWIPFDPSPYIYSYLMTNGVCDPYVVNPQVALLLSAQSDLRTTYVERGHSFQLNGTLIAENPTIVWKIRDEILEFYDSSVSRVLGKNVTNNFGNAVFNDVFLDNYVVGNHTFRADWVVTSDGTKYIIASGQTSLFFTGDVLIVCDKPRNNSEVIRGKQLEIGGMLVDKWIYDKKNGTEMGVIGVNSEIWIILNGVKGRTLQLTNDGKFGGAMYVSISESLGPANMTLYFPGYVVNGVTLLNSTKAFVNVTIFATCKLSVNAEDHVFRNHTFSVNASVVLDNNTIINGTFTLSFINKNKTISNTNRCLWNVFVPIDQPIGYYLLNVTFDPGHPYVKLANIQKKVAVVMNATCIFDVQDSNVTRGEESLILFGEVLNETDDPVSNAPISVELINAKTGKETSMGQVFYTNESGQFIANVTIPYEVEVGNYTILLFSNETIKLTLAMEHYIIINARTEINVNVTPPPPYLEGEEVLVEGRLTDDRGTPISGAVIYVGEKNTTTDAYGHFNITCNAPSADGKNGRFFLSVLYMGSLYYLPSNYQKAFDIFSNVTITLHANKSARPGDKIPIVVNVVTDNSTPVDGRLVIIYVNNTEIRATNIGNGTYICTYVVEDLGRRSYVLSIRAELRCKLYNGTKIFSSGEFIVNVTAEGAPLGISGTVEIAVYVVATVAAVSMVAYYFKKRIKREEKKKGILMHLQKRVDRINDLVRRRRFREAVLEGYKLYEELILLYYHVKRSRGETPAEFARRISERYGLGYDMLLRIVRTFERARYGIKSIGVDEYRSFVEALSKIYKEVTGGILSLAKS